MLWVKYFTYLTTSYSSKSSRHPTTTQPFTTRKGKNYVWKEWDWCRSAWDYNYYDNLATNRESIYCLPSGHGRMSTYIFLLTRVNRIHLLHSLLGAAAHQALVIITVIILMDFFCFETTMILCASSCPILAHSYVCASVACRDLASPFLLSVTNAYVTNVILGGLAWKWMCFLHVSISHIPNVWVSSARCECWGVCNNGKV